MLKMGHEFDLYIRGSQVNLLFETTENQIKTLFI